MLLACHRYWQPLQTLWSAEEMLDGQHQGMDIHAHARTADDDLPQKRLEGDHCWIIPQVPRWSKRLRDRTELNGGSSLMLDIMVSHSSLWEMCALIGQCEQKTDLRLSVCHPRCFLVLFVRFHNSLCVARCTLPWRTRQIQSHWPVYRSDSSRNWDPMPTPSSLR